MYNQLMRYTLLIALFIPMMVKASPADEREEDSIPILESVQTIFGHRINTLANRLDSFFATERADDELGRSSIRLRTRYSIRERAISDLNNRYSFNLRLPHLEEKFKLEYYQDKKDIAKKNKSKVEQRNEDAEKEKKRDAVKTGWIFNADAQVNVSIPPRLTTRARLRRSFDTGSIIHRFVEQITHVTDESGFVHQTSLDSDQTIDEETLFRFTNLARWRINDKDFITTHGPGLIHQLTDDDAISYGFGIGSTIDDGVWYMAGYGLSFTYRRNLYRNWLYLDLNPGLDFPKEWSFRRTPFFTAQLEFLFGG